MDRFIEMLFMLQTDLLLHLKSNMDRFIVVPIGIGIMAVMIFKIQYG